MKISRRHLLAATAAVAVAGTLSVGGLALHWWDQPPDAPYRALSADEAELTRALAAAAYPPGGEPALSGAEAGLDRFLDEVLLAMPAFQRQGLKALLHLLGQLPRLDGRGALLSLPEGQREALVLSWLDHEQALIRQAAQSVIVLLAMGYALHPQASPFFSGLTGCGYGP